jgi:serine/threonine protein kinase
MIRAVQSAAAERFALLFDEEAKRQPPADILPQLQESLGAAYSLERELGGGGMSRVFLARESELGRRVVIKVLPHEMAAGINAERFAREIKLAASCNRRTSSHCSRPVVQRATPTTRCPSSRDAHSATGSRARPSCRSATP